MWPEWVKHVMEQSGASPQARPDLRSNMPNYWNADSTNAVINSPYTDSVAAVTGRPAHIQDVQAPDKLGILGLMINSAMDKAPWVGNQTDANGKTVRLNMGRDSNRGETENTLAHELAHVMDDWNLIGHRDGWYKAVAGRKPPEGSYASTNSTEHYAESFAKAMEMVRGADKLMQGGYKPHPAEVRHMIDEVDNALPGTAYMTQLILSKPPFRDTLFGQYMAGDVKLKPVVVSK